MTLVLYYSPGACSLAAHIAAEEAGVEFELRTVRLNGEDNRRPEYLSLNPRGFVPTLLIDGHPITELAAILDFVATIGPSLAPPREGLAHAQRQDWLAWMSSSVHVEWAQRFRPERFLPEHSAREVLAAYALQRLAATQAGLDARLRQPWALGDKFSVVDAYVFPFYRWANRNGFDMAASYPRWTAHTERMLQRPGVLRVIDREGLRATDWRSIGRPA